MEGGKNGFARTTKSQRTSQDFHGLEILGEHRRLRSPSKSVEGLVLDAMFEDDSNCKMAQRSFRHPL